MAMIATGEDGDMIKMIVRFMPPFFNGSRIWLDWFPQFALLATIMASASPTG